MTSMTLTLGVAPIKRQFLSMQVAKEQKDAFMAVIKAIQPDVVKIVDLDDLCENGIACEGGTVDQAIGKFIDNRVDAIFLPFCDFGEETVAAGIASKFQVPVLVWGARDKYPNSFEQRGRDTQCGIIAATKVLRRSGVKYSYIVNCDADSDKFRKGYESFLRVAMVVKTMKNLKVAQIGNRPVPFMSVIANEGELVEKFGIQCIPLSLPDIAQQADKLVADGDAELTAYYDEFTQRVDCSPMVQAANDPANPMRSQMKDGVIRSLAQTLAIRDAIKKAGCSCASLSCWPSSKIWRGIPCIAIGELSSQGIPISCEGDINGAITLAILNACGLGKDPQFFADLTIRHPENDNAELLWHCGPFPYALKSESSHASMVNFNGCWELRKGEITICRLDCINGEYYLFAGEGKATDGPATTGTYVWFETDNWEQWEEKLVFGPYIHHVGGIYGTYLPVLREAARFLNVRFDTPGMPEVHSL